MKALALLFAALVVTVVPPASANVFACRKGTFITFTNTTKYCVWATLYYSYVAQADWKIERAHDVSPGGTWQTWIAYNDPDLAPQAGYRTEIMNHKQQPCKGAPNLADLRENERIPMNKVDGAWDIRPREATITETNGHFAIHVGPGPAVCK